MTGGAVYILCQSAIAELDEKIKSLPKAFIPKGSINFSELPATLTEDNLGWLWNIKDAFTTDTRFIEGAGKEYPAGNNVAVIKHENAYFYDVMSAIDLANYYTRVEVDTLVNNEKTARVNADSSITTRIDNIINGIHSVDSAINALNYKTGGTIESALNNKQDKLTAGTNITIDANNVISASGGISPQYIELSFYNDGDTGVLTDAQAATLLESELNYIWLNGMHRLDFRYRDDNNNKATYSAVDTSSDGNKTHSVEINLTTKEFKVYHKTLQELISDLATIRSGAEKGATAIQEHQDISGKQDKLIAGTGIILEGNTVSADVRTYKPFPSSWPHGAGTTIANFCTAVNASYKSGEIKVGDAFLGNVSSTAFFNGAYIEGGGALGSAEVSVQIMTPFGQNCVQLLTTTSSNNAPYHWEYTYVDGAASEGWRCWSQYSYVNTKLSLKQDKLTAGDNISIEGTTISAAIYDDTVIKADIAGLKDGTITAGKALLANDAMNYAEGGSISSAINSKQNTLVSGTNIKTINGSSVLGSGNLEVKTYLPFPNGDLNGTLPEVVAAIKAFPNKAQGMAYLGMIRGTCTPFGYGNVECIVTFMTSSIAILSVSSSNIKPYHWEYNTAANDYQWKKYSDVTVSTSGSSSTTVNYITVDGTEYKLPSGGSAPDTYLSDASVDADNNLKIQNKDGQDIVNCTVNYTLTNDKVKAVLTDAEKETLLSGVTGTTWVAANTNITAHTEALGGLKFVALTQAEYEALATKDANTLYIIK